MRKVGWLRGLLFCSLILPVVAHAASDAKTVKMVIPRGSTFVLSYFGARDAGIFRKHGIDIEVDARPFAGFMAGLPSRQVSVGTYAGLNAVEQMNQGKDLIVIGGGLTSMQDVWVQKDSPLKKLSDLKGKKFGVWSRGAGATKALEALAIDGFKLDLNKDVQTIEIAGPALMALLDKGEVDAMFNLSSLSIAAASQPEKYRLLFSPDDYWREKTGSPLVWSAPTIAWKDWIDQDRERAKNIVEALHESWRWLRQNSDKAVEKYGKLAGVQNAAEAATLKKMLQAGGIFLDKWDPKIVDSQWKFLDLAKQVGIIKAVPAKDKYSLVLR
ncbi:MAG TPA: ABC transporter substrate-binding protein [Candidatus Binatia bacterium]|jgi:ABC-type nitrate/sulfonate/bicarbonate transport system substrate-binding protein|nr:ABC transporter substrate-binding protein [Candidatus Binatia bacterium]